MRAGNDRRSTAATPGDAGFTIVESIVAIGIIGIVMTALVTFFVGSMRTSGLQTGRQAAVQVADDAMERVRSLKPAILLDGRDRDSVTAQWGSPVAGVAPYLGGMTMTWDSDAASGDGVTAALPTSPLTVLLAGVAYRQSFYVGSCQQSGSTGGACTTATGGAPFYRVVVAVTWPDTGCRDGACSYVTTTMISSATVEPVFDSNDQATPPQIIDPGTQDDDINSTVSLQLKATGGTAPLTWISVDGLPDGLAMSSSGLITGNVTKLGTYPVTVTVRDDYDLTNTATFGWDVNRLPTLVTPPKQTGIAGTAITPVQLTVSDGSPAFSFTADTALPSGLTLDRATGRIAGTPASPGNNPVTTTVKVTVADKNGNRSSATWDWKVNPALSVTKPANQSTKRNTAATPVTVAAKGGSGSYTWSQTGLPAGLTINAATGQISGTPTGNTASVTVKATDSDGFTATATFTWTVTP